MTTLTDAIDTVMWSSTILERLETAAGELSKKQGLHEEKAWLKTAIERVTAARQGIDDTLSRAMRLPELESMREEHSEKLQNEVVDAVERLHAGITFHAGTRAPLLEALYAKLKVPQLRRADRSDFEKFCVDFEKRLNSSYSKRMLADVTFAFALPVIEQFREAVTAWKESFSAAQALPAEEQSALHEELENHARRLEHPMRQARLLAEAALAPVKNAFDASGIGQKPKRRAAVAKPVVEAAAMEDSAEAEANAETESEAAETVETPAPEVIEAVAPKRREKRPKPSA